MTRKISSPNRAKKNRSKKCESDSDTDSDADFEEVIETEEYGELDPVETAFKEQLEADLIINESENNLKHRSPEQHLEIKSKIANLNHEQQQSFTKQATREAGQTKVVPVCSQKQLTKSVQLDNKNRESSRTRMEHSRLVSLLHRLKSRGNRRKLILLLHRQHFQIRLRHRKQRLQTS
jgi:hypothetical protein